MEFETSVQSFVIKIWLEESAEESGRAVWRGRIVHVASDTRKSIKSTDEIVAFIQSYVGISDRNPGWLCQLGHWLKRWSEIICSWQKW